MKKLFLMSMSFFITGIFFAPLLSQENTNCTGYPTDEICCLKNRGAMVSDDSSSFCYLNLLTSKVTKAQCMDAGGYAYWRNDSTMLCLPKGMSVMTGDVSSVDENARSIFLMSEGNTYTIITPWATLPKQGEYIDVYYTMEPDGSMHGKTCHPVVRQPAN